MAHKLRIMYNIIFPVSFITLSQLRFMRLPFTSLDGKTSNIIFSARPRGAWTKVNRGGDVVYKYFLFRSRLESNHRTINKNVFNYTSMSPTPAASGTRESASRTFGLPECVISVNKLLRIIFV